MEQVIIDKERLDFLKWIYFGSTDNCYEAASRRAYLDMCRTIRFGKKDGKEIRANIDKVIEKEIKVIIRSGVTSQEQYDSWHYHLCDNIVREYRKAGIDFHIGQAQKWINMTMKYLYIIGDVPLDKIFEYLHVPLDNYVYDAVYKKLGISRPNIPWSRIDDYKLVYLPYQRMIKATINIAPLKWELRNWLEEAKFNAYKGSLNVV